MADPQRSATSNGNDKGPGDHAQELWDLVRAYAQQETIDPLKTLGRFVGFGLAAAVTGGIGVTLITVGLLRVLQTETGSSLTGSLNWIPYVIGLVLCGLLIGLALRSIPDRSEKKGR